MFQRKILMLLFILCLGKQGVSQPGFSVTDPERRFKEVRELMLKQQYALAYSLIKDLKISVPPVGKATGSFIAQDLKYYDLVCRLRLGMPAATTEAEVLMGEFESGSRKEQLAFEIGHYYFLHNEFDLAVEFFDQIGHDNLSNEQFADAKFEKAYAYFNLKQFEKAKPLFNEIHQLKDHKYYFPSNYYFGFISYYNKEHAAALASFKEVEHEEAYKGIVPYYIAEIYYMEGQKEEAIKYGEEVLAKGERIFYDAELKLLLGQLYFEKKNFEKAMFFLEFYCSRHEKVSKEILYELSYSYYKNGVNNKAMEGFKQLSNEKDSMGQNSMYILGDLYLKAGQKDNARNAFQFSAFNSSNKEQQEISKFQYAKLSYELGYQDVALKEFRSFQKEYPLSDYLAETKELLLELLGNTNNYAEALEVYKSMASPTPAMKKILPRIQFGRTVELINEQQNAEAKNLLLQVIADPSATEIVPYAYFWLAELDYRAGNYDDCIAEINKFRKAPPAAQGEVSQAAAAYILGYAQFQKGNYPAAISAFSELGQKLNSNSNLMLQDAVARTADAHYLLKQYDKASELYDKVIQSGSAQADNATFQKAMLAGLKDPQAKINLLKTIGQKYPKSALLQEVNMEIGMTLLAEEQPRDAVVYFEKVLSSEDESMKPKALLKAGIALNNANDNKAALANLESLISRYPNAEETQEAIGVIKDIYMEEGKTDDYVELMKKNGINISVNEADSLSFSGASNKYYADDCQSAVSGFDNYIRKYPDGAYLLDAYFMRSDCFKKTKQWQKALDGFSVINSKGPSKYFEKSTFDAARIAYLEIKDFRKSLELFQSLYDFSLTPDFKLEALRGLVRSYYQLNEFAKASETAKELISTKGSSSDDQTVGYLVLGKSQEVQKDSSAAITSFKSVAASNKSGWGAEARYEMAACYFSVGDMNNAEKMAMAVIKETGSYELWVTKAYLLLGDILMRQEDYFNAKATYESVYRNSSLTDLKEQARIKFEQAKQAEGKKSRISNSQK